MHFLALTRPFREKFDARLQENQKETDQMRTTCFGKLSPGIEKVLPDMVTEGGPTLTLDLQGVGFTKRSRVQSGDTHVPATVVSEREMKITIDASLIAHAGTFPITVTNPEPLQRPQWGGTSNKGYLLVNFRYWQAEVACGKGESDSGFL